MNKLLVVVMLSAVVAVAMAATKEEMMAKKLAFKVSTFYLKLDNVNSLVIKRLFNILSLC